MVKPYKYSYISLQFNNTQLSKEPYAKHYKCKKYPKCENFNLYMVEGDINLWSSFFKTNSYMLTSR